MIAEESTNVSDGKRPLSILRRHSRNYVEELSTTTKYLRKENWLAVPDSKSLTKLPVFRLLTKFYQLLMSIGK
jgi:hypothetical protein